MTFMTRIRKWLRLHKIGRKKKLLLKQAKILAKKERSLRVARSYAIDQMHGHPKSMVGAHAQILVVDIDARMDVIRRDMADVEADLKVLNMDRERVENDLLPS